MISGFPDGTLTDFTNKLALHYLDGTQKPVSGEKDWLGMDDLLEGMDRDSDLGQGVGHQSDY